MNTPWTTLHPERPSVTPKNHAVDWIDPSDQGRCLTRCGLIIPNRGLELDLLGLPRYDNCRRCKQFLLGDLEETS